MVNNTTVKYRAVRWSIDEGLGKERWHLGMLKDVNGFMWFGSNHGELSRFDGFNFKQYIPDKNKPGAIRSNNCLSFVEDSLHNIWIGTNLGLSRYDIKADTFTNFKTIPGEFAVPFWASNNEIFYMEADSLVSSYNIHSLKKTTRLNIKGLALTGKVKMGSATIPYTIFDSVSNSIWMLRENGEGLAQIFLTTGKITYHYRSPYKMSQSGFHHKDAEAMCYDRGRNCIWINSHDGLVQFSLANQQFHRIDALNPLVNLKEYDRWVGIDIDPKGRIWLATIPMGMIIFDPASQSVIDPLSNISLQKEVTEGNLKIYCDRDGMVWTSYWGVLGIYQLIPYSPSIHRYMANAGKPDSLSSLDILNMLRGEQGRLWIGTQNGGLNIFNPGTGTFQVLREKDLPGIKGNGIVPLFIDTLRKKAWLSAGPPFRVYEMDISTKKCKMLVFEDDSNHIITPVHIVNNICQPFRNGFLFLDAGYGIFEVTGDELSARLVIPIDGAFIVRMIIGEDKKLFLYPAHTTYYDVNGKWIKTPHPMDSTGWTDMYYDKTDQTYWVGVYREIIHYNKDFLKIRSYTDEEGLIGEPLSILPDGRGNIWFNNDRKIIGILNIRTGTITTLSEQDGYKKQSYDWTSPQAKAAGGELYFPGYFLPPGKAGLDRVNPGKFIGNAAASLVYLKSLKINQKDFPLPAGANNLQVLSLRHFENKISIETGIINFFSMGKSHIRYKLESGLKDAAWEYAPAYYTIRFEDLHAGKYRLVMQASNAANEFNGPEKTLLINIRPAFWNTWWFRIIAVIFAVATLYTFIRWRFQQKFLVKFERSEKEKQLADMRLKTSEMEMQALRAQMNPHFIFNSLNSINKFILQNDSLKASEYLTTFSKLVRMILQNSQAPYINLESELEALSLYLEIEAMRFNYHFTYKITVPDNLDTELLKIPPLIIQPYAENAIWYGLMHKEERGELDIEISQENDQLNIRITDNGIGRKRAAELANNSSTRHKSMGLQITAHRIALMQQTGSGESAVIINDLSDPGGNASGTEVTIKMPVLYD